MGIFDFSKPDNYSKISEEWQIFENVFPEMGAFKYIPARKTAYLDDNTYKILRIERTSEDGSVPEDDFFSILKNITLEPIRNKRHVYNYRCGNESFWIKLSMIEKNGQWLGFIKDMTLKMQEITFSESFSILNSVTKLNNREAFLEEIRILAETKSVKYGCLAAFHINGINHLNKILGVDNSKRCISSASRTISHFASDDIIIGSTPYCEFLVFFKNKNEQEAVALMHQIAMAVHETRVTDDFGEALIPGSDARLSLNCGYSMYPDDSTDFNMLVNYSGFALFEILENTTGMIKKFEPKSYEKEKEYYTDAQIFCKIIDDNLFEYHMQPIVDAKTGAVYGYEALMRTTGNKYLNPFQMLEIAKKQKRTYDIEKKTFFNVMKILNDNIDMFKDKKLFINSIPDHMLNENDFSELNHIYGELMNKVVIEITEQANLSDAFLDQLNLRRKRTGLEVAFDDYGTGYSNTANLIRYDPDYIKIDRSLISNIDTDTKKKQLVSSITLFAVENGIKTLAEGIETSSELSTVINLGVDLIQGYYTSRPKPFILYEISKDVKDEIINANALKSHELQPYCITETERLNADDVDCNLYGEILVRRKSVTLTGGENILRAGIVTDNDMDCTVTIKNVHIMGRNDSPAIAVGENSSLTLVVEGENRLDGAGIYVPETSSVTIKGDGVLEIISDRDSSYGIGADKDSPYGDIFVCMTGRLSVDLNGIYNIAIGGGRNSFGKIIRLESGELALSGTGKTCVCVGNVSGNSVIETGKNCSVDIECSAVDNVSIGSLKGTASVEIGGNVTINASGRNSAGIGSLFGGRGIVEINDGNVDVSIAARNVCCIGSDGGEMEISAENSSLNLTASGIDTVGIGDRKGKSEIRLSENRINIKLNGEKTLDIGSPEGSIKEDGNTISTNTK